MPFPHQVALNKFLDRLHNSVRRSGLINASPARSAKRMDLARLGDADPALPGRILTQLIRSDTGSVRLDLPIAKEGEEDDHGRSLYYNLVHGLARTAEAFKRETGVRSLWLAYPLFYARTGDESKDTKVLAPVFLWPIKIEASLHHQGRVILSRDEEAGGPKYNKVLDLWITNNLNFNPDDPHLDDFAETSREKLQEVITLLYRGLSPPPEVSLLGRLLPVPDRKRLDSHPSPQLFHSAILGLIQWENQALANDVERLAELHEVTELTADFLTGQGRETSAKLVVPPEADRFHVSEADPAQERAVWAARSGPGVLIHGPPGTGKSQTIVNLIADSLAHDQRVLVVCQKRAAIDVVAARLKAHGLASLFSVIHDSDSDRARTILDIKEQIVNLRSREPNPEIGSRRASLAAEIESREQILSEYHDATCGCGPMGLAYRDLLANIAKLHAGGPRIQTNPRLEGLFAGKTHDQLLILKGPVVRCAQLGEQARPASNPWRFRLKDVGLGAMLGGAIGQALAELQSAVEWQASHTGQPANTAEGRPPLAKSWKAALRLMPNIRSAADVGAVLRLSLFNVRKAPAASRLIGQVDTLGEWLDQRCLKPLKSQVLAGKPIAAEVAALRDGFARIEPLQMLDATKAGLAEWPRQVVDVLEKEYAPDPVHWWRITQLSAMCAWEREMIERKPVLRQVNTALLDEAKQRLAHALSEKRKLEAAYIEELWHMRQTCRKRSDFNGILVSRGRNSKRLRQVVELGQPVGLFDFRPCWLTNPNTASQIFPLTPGIFDLVIFDEASQCPIEQAIPAIYRGQRVVVAGDEKQLPPTAFFRSGFSFDDETPDAAETAAVADEDAATRVANANQAQALAVEDLLQAAKPLLQDRWLNIHYRSEHPALITFSNHAFYLGHLQMPPSIHGPASTPPLVLLEVAGTYADNRNRTEANQVVGLLKELWLAPGITPTVGVVTFNETQRDLIEDLLAVEAEQDPLFQKRYVEERNRTEDEQDVGFFVKNLESVQGDERDIMVFSTTFGRDAQGGFRRFFGPLNLAGGERRLNVAITRAKRRNYIVTSLPLNEISNLLAGGAVAAGAKISGRDYLHAYMQFVRAVSAGDPERQEQVLRMVCNLSAASAPRKSAGNEESPFESEVRDAITALGYETVTQVGESGFRIDLAVLHPDKSCGFVLGIECDGKAYHSEWTARARDIWRQRILEKRGWTIHRVWSTDWWRDRNAEINKLQARLELLLRQ